MEGKPSLLSSTRTLMEPNFHPIHGTVPRKVVNVVKLENYWTIYYVSALKFRIYVYRSWHGIIKPNMYEYNLL